MGVPFAMGATQVVRMEDKDNIPVDNKTYTPISHLMPTNSLEEVKQRLTK